MMTGEFGMGFGGIFMWVFWLFWIILIIWAVVIVAGNRRESSAKQKTALDILKERYAKGEIDQQKFAQMKKDLEE
jgi:putative membrane protein